MVASITGATMAVAGVVWALVRMWYQARALHRADRLEEAKVGVEIAKAERDQARVEAETHQIEQAHQSNESAQTSDLSAVNGWSHDKLDQ